MKKLFLANTVVLALASIPAVSAYAAEEHTFSANLGLFSDYRFRGLSQTSNDLALQGGFDYAHSSGLYAGNWNSNVSFGQAGSNYLESDFYGGYTSEIYGIGYDVGLLYYRYSGNPQPAQFDTFEAYGKLKYAGFTGAVYYSLGEDYFNFVPPGANQKQSGSTYLNLSYKYPITDKLSVSAAVGTTSFDKNVIGLNGAPVDGYNDYSVGVSYALGKFNLGASIVGADKDGENLGGKDAAKSDLVLSIGTSF